MSFGTPVAPAPTILLARLGCLAMAPDFDVLFCLLDGWPASVPGGKPAWRGVGGQWNAFGFAHAGGVEFSDGCAVGIPWTGSPSLRTS